MAERELDMVEELRAILRKPFHGLVLKTSDGESIRVPHQDYIFIAPDGTTLHLYDDEQNPHILNVRQLVSITPDKSKRSAARGDTPAE